ncbi:MAG: hypothetical protein BAX61_13350 [Psychrobacter sp. B29-1]|uniref:hypothetical protein n=1 Tax=Psychrobacter sp. B29-1 TaxID=1867800 RepID=UPI00086F8FB9|nr:hypothetical protein [Psychrobacter sp. B29-1]OEH66785.1 MAG: hypothetical protein BAX61_13350 [Psychrobacter sp. B29-1]
MEWKYKPDAIKAATARVLALFEEFKTEYGDLFEYKKHRFTTARAREWAVELLESGINAEQYQNARYQAVKNQKYPIERAYEFIQLCQQSALNDYPEIRDAYTRAANLKYKKHEVIYETAKRVGFWNLKTQPESISYKSWQKHYPEVCKEHSEGADFKVPESHQVEYSHTPLQETSPMAATVDEFLNQFKRKHGEQA